ncbi:MAG: hypothetical protein IPJ84_17085 [Bdellovibrionales bacterium]|nr:hypothetical protein [Bdellovibrionales bacterium]
MGKICLSQRALVAVSGLFLIASNIGCERLTNAVGGALTTSTDSEALRPLTQAEALADYDTMIESIHSLYGPLEYKERRFGYKFDTEAARIRQELSLAKTEDEKLGKFYETLRLLQDGHVSMQTPFRTDKRISIVAVPVGTSFYVDFINPNLAAHGIERGDEIIAIDGQTPEDLLKIVLKYSWWGNAESDRHMAYMLFSRPSYMAALQPPSAIAKIEVKKANGDRTLARIPWIVSSPFTKTQLRPMVASLGSLAQIQGAQIFSEKAGALNEARAAATDGDTSLVDMGAVKPYYWSRRIQNTFGATRVTPDLERAKFYYAAWTRDVSLGEDRAVNPLKIPDEFPEVFAALYRYNGKTVFMMRQPGYMADDIVANLAVYSALIEQYQPIADVLVIDQTHNPGGSVWYVDSFARLFAPKGLNGFVQFLNNDRKWISSLLSWIGSLDPATLATSPTAQYIRTTIAGIETDQEAGLRLTREPFAFGPTPIQRAAPITWNKPILVTIDELCASGGDAFPKLMQSNKLATIFGRRTAGMGGSVEPVVELPYSRSKVNLTRGLFTAYKPDGQYSDADMVENNGVQPDLSYSHTVDDFRAGYPAYFKALSEAATAL